MIYVKNLTLPSEYAEIEVIKNEKRTCFHNFYPFKIFPEKQLTHVELEGITLFYGGNGSGKSTLINLMAHKVNAIRYSRFNDAPFFDKYVQMCSVEYAKMPQKSYVLSSDDVFDYALKARSVNERIDDRRNELLEDYVAVHREIQQNQNSEILRIKGMDDYERWKNTMEILSPRHSQSSYVRKRVARDIDLHSNGETAMRYFLERIDEDALYFLDEPENSLSIELQLELAEYIAAIARATRSQFVIATHSPILLSMKNAKIYNLDDFPASVCPWTELPNVRKYFDFFMEHRDEFDRFE